jgi:hypothetical protein
MGQHKRRAAFSFNVALLWLLGGATAIAVSALVFAGWIPMAFRMRGAGRLFAIGLIMVLTSIGMFFHARKREH